MCETKIPSLRARQKAATQELILETALEMFHSSGTSFSHETIAERAGMSSRTVYRYFPTQAELFMALWERHREQTETLFPTREEELLPLVDAQFRHFEEHEALVRAALASPASAEILAYGWKEGHEAFQNALSRITASLPPEESRRLVAVFQSIYSAPFWQMLRTRGRLTGDEAKDAATWTMGALLEAAKARADHLAANDSAPEEEP